ncbi:MAG: heavy metal-responsive transcriptional regulator [Myxococcales bacterium]|jgi:DNA-binding transcriptional MerR regulator|nr:heavy metal-responsive transcriptional regulator [Myxococcales bacterium]MBL9111392.1 heavy metal-responsive transcriptional regulator [Myxococcales bacterium]
MVEPAGSMSIGELARRAGVAVDTLRYYERLGLLEPAGRTKTGYRRFGPEAEERLGFIGRAKSLGFTLADVAELLRLRARPGAPCAAVREKAREQLAVVDQKLAELSRLRAAVAALVGACQGDRAVERCSILEALARPTLEPRGAEPAGTIVHEGESSWETVRAPVKSTATSRVSRRARRASKSV